MAGERGNWVWNLLRRRSRKELDKLEAELIKRPGEKRQFAGDPAQVPGLKIPPQAQVILRPSREADDAFFQEMEFRTTWQSLSPADRERLSPEEVRAALALTHELLLNRPGNQVIVAEEQGERVGLLWLGINRNVVTGEDEAWVYNLSVVESSQGRGIGRRLMEHAEKLARESGFHTLGLMVASHNTRATALYEKMGLQPTNVLMRKKLDPLEMV